MTVPLSNSLLRELQLLAADCLRLLAAIADATWVMAAIATSNKRSTDGCPCRHGRVMIFYGIGSCFVFAYRLFLQPMINGSKAAKGSPFSYHFIFN